MKRVSMMVIGLCTAAGLVVGCGGSNSGTGGNGAAGGGGSSPAGGGGSSGGGGGTAGGGGAMSPPDLAMPVTAALPFAVDDQYATSGYMGDGATTGIVTMLPTTPADSHDCNGDRSSTTALGVCHTITYTPAATPVNNWAGVYWQYPANNWGTKPGYTIPPGATKVSFQAKGAVGGEKVSFIAGGIVNAGMSYTDSLKATANVVLTNGWMPYSIDLTGQSYTQVLGAFAWTMAGPDAGVSAKFFVDDIQWQ